MKLAVVRVEKIPSEIHTGNVITFDYVSQNRNWKERAKFRRIFHFILSQILLNQFGTFYLAQIERDETSSSQQKAKHKLD